MNTDPLSIREQEIFSTLKQLQNREFVVIGGYAVNAYTLPRFSVDCDIIIRDEELQAIEKTLLKNGYNKEEPPEEAPYLGSFARYKKTLENGFSVSMDVLIGAASDRATGGTFSADWAFQNSSIKNLKGKTIAEELKLRIMNAEALVTMKIVSCRDTDIRDVFMMLPATKNKEWIQTEVSARYDFNDRISKIIEKVTSKQFKDGIAGVYGQIDDKTFERHMKTIMSLSAAN